MEEIALLKKVSAEQPGAAQLRDIELRLEAGEAAALCGPSGCGKTTLLRLLAGRLEASFGEVLVFGERIRGNALAFAKTGCLFADEQPALRRTVEDALLRCAAQFKGIGREQISDTARLLGVWELMDRRYGELSPGQAKRVRLALAFINNPRLILLDDPFDNLDPDGAAKLSAAVKLYTKKKGAACLMATGSAAAQSCCGRAIVLSGGGRIAGEFDMHALPALRESYRYSFRTDKPHTAAAILGENGYSPVLEGELVYAALRPKNLSALLKDLCEAGLAVYEVCANEGGFESRYRDTLDLMGGFEMQQKRRS